MKLTNKQLFEKIRDFLQVHLFEKIQIDVTGNNITFRDSVINIRLENDHIIVGYGIPNRFYSTRTRSQKFVVSNFLKFICNRCSYYFYYFGDTWYYKKMVILVKEKNETHFRNLRIFFPFWKRQKMEIIFGHQLSYKPEFQEAAERFLDIFKK